MKMKALANLAALSSVAMCLGVAPGFADAEHCRHVGGSVFTNFVDQTDAAGPVSGDLAGAVSVEILAINGDGEVMLRYSGTVCFPKVKEP